MLETMISTMTTKSTSSQSASRHATPQSDETINDSHDIDLEAQKATPSMKEASTTTKKARNWKPNPRTISDVILGLSDGLTVPFALSAGLSTLGDTKLVVLGGLAELIAGAISMGLGGFVGAKSEEESYNATLRETNRLIQRSPDQTSTMVHEVFNPFGLPDSTTAAVVVDLQDTPSKLSKFLMTFHHQLAAPASSRAYVSAMALALGYFAGGFIPLVPYFCVKRSEVMLALYWSIGIMAVTLLAFGYLKTGIVRGWAGQENAIAAIKGGIQMLLVGGIAAGAAIGLVRAIDHGTSIRG